MASLTSLPITPRNLFLLLKIYIKTWINIIIYNKRIYPTNAFEISKNSLNLAIPWNRHPLFNSWCDGLIQDLIDNLSNITSINCLIIDSLDKVREKYVLNVSELYHLKNVNNLDNVIKDLKWGLIIEEFRSNLVSLMRKIQKSEVTDDEEDHEEHDKFNIVCESNDNDKTTNNINTNWTIDDDNDYPNSQFKVNITRTIPLKFIDVGPIIIYSSIELYE